jgi:Zn-dependent protease with chaperone function
VVGVLTLIAARDYMRYREYAADAYAVLAIDDVHGGFGRCAQCGRRLL